MSGISPTMTEGNLSKWLVKKGGKIKPGDLIAEIETDKATMEVEAVDEGGVLDLLYNEGDANIPVNKVLLRPNLLAKYPPLIFVITPQNS